MMMEPPDFPEASPDPRAERPQLWVKRSTQSRIKETETQKATEPRGRVDAMGFGRIEAELDANGAAEKTTVDPETGLTLGEVLEQAEEQEIDFLSMEEGETVSLLLPMPAPEPMWM